MQLSPRSPRRSTQPGRRLPSAPSLCLPPWRHPARAEPGLSEHGLWDHAVGRRGVGGHPHLLPAVLGARRGSQGHDPPRRTERPEGPGPLDRRSTPGAASCGDTPSDRRGRAGNTSPGRIPDHRDADQHASITIIPAVQRPDRLQRSVSAFGPGAPGTLQVLVPEAKQSAALATLGTPPESRAPYLDRLGRDGCSTR